MRWSRLGWMNDELMRLKSLELSGYKTFANKNLFEFAHTITAIVGPNGSGKSNIVDALRWVLGEQSFSLLRGRKTVDMIFSGSEHRSRAGMAFATVLFNNEDNWLPIDFSEVAITRRAYRDGQNEYLLNGQKVRLKDVSELLGTSGLAERTYTIVGQGLIDTALSLRADERRKLFEEAAGIGLYRSRREEALRRLNTTQRNLERVRDILEELKPRLRSLERQSRRAQEYEQVKADLQVMLREWYGYHWHRAQRDLKAAREQANRQETVLKTTREKHAGIEEQMTAIRDDLFRVRARLNSWHRELSQLHNRRENLSRDLAVSAERQRALKERRVSLTQTLTRLEEELALHRVRAEAAEKDVEHAQSLLTESRQQLETARKALDARQRARQKAERVLEDARQHANQLTNRRAGMSARLTELESRLDRQRMALTAADQSLAQTTQAIQVAETKVETAAQELSDAQKAREKAQTNLQNHREHMIAIEQTRKQSLDARASLNTEIARLQAQLQVLDQAEKSLSGYAEGTRQLLQAAQKGQLTGARGALSSYLDVPAELETAIASALGEYTDGVLLNPDAGVESALSALEEISARAVLLPLGKMAPVDSIPPPGDSAYLGLAADLIHAPAELRPVLDVLLGRTWVVRDRAGAQRLGSRSTLPVGTRIVTLTGELFRVDGPIQAGAGGGAGTISRPRQRRELSNQLEAVQEQVADFAQQIQQLEVELAQLRGEESQYAEAVRIALGTEEQAHGDRRDARAVLDTTRKQQEWQSRQRAEIEKEIIMAEKDFRQATEEIAQLENEFVKAQEAVKEAQTQISGLALEDFQGQVAHWTAQNAVAERAVNDASSRRDERETALDAAQQELQRQSAEIALVEHEMEELETSRAQLRQEESQLGGQMSALQVLIQPAEVELETEERAQETIHTTETDARHALNVAERHHAQAQIGLARSQEALDALRRRIEDDFGLVAFEYEEDVAGPTPLPLAGMVETLPVVQVLSPELGEAVKRQRAQLRRIGPVNPEAQHEFQEVKERLEFTTIQIADLEKAEDDIRQVVAELDGLMEREFRRTFDAVAQVFKVIFTRLFGGGTAQLLLTDPEDLTNTGVEIEARLPGRRPQELSLLSGGERSLTASALIFSLLKVSPTPFCVLDEVDAMLDEVNVHRFADLLRELSINTQFIIITHNRNTVQVADTIYGITMGPDSTSQVLSLKLDEVAERMKELE